MSRLNRAVLVAAQGLLQELGEGARLNHIPPRPHPDLAFEQLLEQLDGEVPLWHPANLGEELIGQDRDVGPLQASGGEDVDDLVGRHSPRDNLADCV